MRQSMKDALVLAALSAVSAALAYAIVFGTASRDETAATGEAGFTALMAAASQNEPAETRTENENATRQMIIAAWIK